MKGDTQKKPYLDANLQSGTTPLVKKAGNLNTRNFTNFRHPEIKDSDRNGVRAILTDQYKLIVQGEGEKQKIELFDIRADAEETSDLMASNPDRADDLTQKLQAWQQSVLNSLTAADY